MAIPGLLLLCFAVVVNQALSQSIPCSGATNNLINNVNAPALRLAGANIGNIGTSPLTITSATFTPLTNSLACQAGLPGPTISEVIPNLKCGDVSLTGDLPIGGTIKVCGCFPVYGMVAVDGVVPSCGSAVVNTGSAFPAQLIENTCGCSCAR